MNRGAEVNILAVYVDDFLIACSTDSSMQSIKNQIKAAFKCVDKGPVTHFLGIEVERIEPRGAIAIHQHQYIRELLERHRMEACRPCFTPLDPGMTITKCQNKSCKKEDPSYYQSIVGAVMYLAVSTRPDICHTISKLSQYNVDPHSEHLGALRHLLRYIKTTTDAKLMYTKSADGLKGYVDADWGGNTDDRRSYTGFVFTFGGGVISWESKKQLSVALSSTEAEYMALSQASKEAVYLRNLVSELGLVNANFSVLLFNDNIGAQQLVKNPVHHPRSKHIDIRYLYIRDLYEDGVIDLKYLCTDDMMADVFTKNLAKTKHLKFSSMLGIPLT